MKSKVKTKIYLAGSCSSEKRTMMQGIAGRLRAVGFEVYCPFEFKVPSAWEMSQEEWAAKVFEADKKAMQACDIFLLITPGRESTAGSNWEQGYVYALGKNIVVVQYTESDTSLMTYCGSDDFVVCPEKDLNDKIVSIVDTYITCVLLNKKADTARANCITTLT